MPQLLRHRLPELAALSFGVGLFALAGSLWLGVTGGLIILSLLRGLVHTPDNTVHPLYLLGNYWKCVEPGFHTVAWPFVSCGSPIDTCYQAAACELDGVFSTDRVPFSAHVDFPYRFQPLRVTARQRAAELILRGAEGRLRVAQEVARGAALGILRQFSHYQLLSGLEQTQIQERVARELEHRLASFGIEVQVSALRLSLHGPRDLEAAFVQQQAALPAAQGLVTNMLEILRVISRFPHPDVQRYLDLHMTQVMNQQRSDPLTTLLAREWFRQGSSRTVRP